MPRQLDAASVERFLVDYAEALAAGDGARVATMWQLPALVLSDEGSLVVDSVAQVEEFFTGAAGQYRERDIVETRPEHVAIEHLSDRLCTVDVRWIGLDDQGRPVAERELSSYVLRTDDDGVPRIQVAVARPSRIPIED